MTRDTRCFLNTIPSDLQEISKKLPAFRYGVDEIPEWFQDMMKMDRIRITDPPGDMLLFRNWVFFEPVWVRPGYWIIRRSKIKRFLDVLTDEQYQALEE
jgi:hypothetical protein